MAITRTPIIDDDGSGTTGTVIDNAWKQELYNQIDGVITPVTPTQGSWTPVDASGGGLVFSSVVGRWARIGNVITIWGQVIYPATSNTALAAIGGLPVPNSNLVSGAIVVYGVPAFLHISASGSVCLVFNPSTFGQRTNAEMANAFCIFTGSYLAA